MHWLTVVRSFHENLFENLSRLNEQEKKERDGKKEKSIWHKYNPIELSNARCTDRPSSNRSAEIYSRKSLSFKQEKKERDGKKEKSIWYKYVVSNDRIIRCSLHRSIVVRSFRGNLRF